MFLQPSLKLYFPDNINYEMDAQNSVSFVIYKSGHHGHGRSIVTKKSDKILTIFWKSVGRWQNRMKVDCNDHTNINVGIYLFCLGI